MSISKQMSTYRYLLIFLLTAILLFLSDRIEACTCSRGRTITDDISSSRAIFSGKVLYTNHSIKRKWVRAKYQIFDWTGIKPPEYTPRNEGVSVTFEVINSWKGLQDDVVTFITGFGGGDCGFPFEPGEEYLVYVNKYSDWGDDISICSRTDLLKNAGTDLATLGPPLKLTHKSVAFHIVRSHVSAVAFIITVSAGLFVYFKIRRSRKSKQSND